VNRLPRDVSRTGTAQEADDVPNLLGSAFASHRRSQRFVVPGLWPGANGVDEARRDTVDRDLVWGQIVGERSCESHETGFRGDDVRAA
jgi:hypothetical protein